MKLIISGIFIATLTIFGFGQGSRVSGGSSHTSNASAAADRNSGQISLAEGTRVDGELQKTLDVKNVRPGDQVLLKTTNDVKQNGRTVIQKGSTLVGRVTDVAQRSKQNGQSRLGMLFDRVRGHGLDMPITASIVSITQAAANAQVADVADADIFVSGSTSGGASTGRSSGGLLGGSAGGGGLLNGVGNTAGSVVGTTRQTVVGVTNSLGSTAGGVTNGVATGTRGISILSSGSTGAAAGNGSILASSDHNIRLEKGSALGLQLNSFASASATRQRQ